MTDTNMNSSQTASPAEVSGTGFIERLAKLDRGDMAVLKRSAGSTLAEARNAMSVFYRIYPARSGDRDEEIFFLIATLYASNPQSLAGNFGITMKAIRNNGGSPEAVDRRMSVLLDSEFDVIDGFRNGGGEMAYRLRQCVKLAASKQVGVNWPQLIGDLRFWGHPSRRVRKQWARTYFGETKFALINSENQPVIESIEQKPQAEGNKAHAH